MSYDPRASICRASERLSEVLGTLPVRATSTLMSFPQASSAFRPRTRGHSSHSSGRHLIWLQSTDLLRPRFPVVDPFLYFLGTLPVDLSPPELARLNTPLPQDIWCWRIVTMPSQQGERCTANLQAPFV
jgi:flagellar assembly factor FliW